MKHIGYFGAVLLCIPLWADWEPLGPFGGSAAIVVADPHSPRTFLAAARNALLFRSLDAGESWLPLPFPAELHAALNVLAVDPQTPGVWLAGLSSDLPEYSGILRTADGGATWRQVPGLKGEQVRAIAFKRAHSRIVTAGTDSGVFASRDAGATWQRISPADNSGLRPVVALAFDSNDSEILYAGTPHLPWKTSDGGASWQSIHVGMLEDSDVFSIQVDRNRPLRVFAGACSGIYRSINGGSSWNRLTETANSSSRTYAIAQDPQHENVWFAGTRDGMLRSLNGGTTWEKIGSFSTRSIAFDPGRLGRILIATEEAGILRSEDNGQTWQPSNYGFCNRRLLLLWISRGTTYTIALDGSVLRLADNTREWIPVGEAPGDKPSVSHVVWTTGGRLIAGTPSGLKSSDDSGRSWHPVRGELEADTIQAICRHPQKASWLFAAKFGVLYSSSDGGRSWRKFSPTVRPIESVKQLLVAPGKPDRLLVVTAQQGIWELPIGNVLSVVEH